ncbi:hypothetical protein DFH27DRAFT_522165 [Peziza echinospora]|nr:hypothetical protein DFH27DRAFT_522165 [Peziza echinospora]
MASSYIVKPTQQFTTINIYSISIIRILTYLTYILLATAAAPCASLDLEPILNKNVTRTTLHDLTKSLILQEQIIPLGKAYYVGIGKVISWNFTTKYIRIHVHPLNLDLSVCVLRAVLFQAIKPKYVYEQGVAIAIGFISIRMYIPTPYHISNQNLHNQAS